jgi:hypothetical protein
MSRNGPGTGDGGKGEGGRRSWTLGVENSQADRLLHLKPQILSPGDGYILVYESNKHLRVAAEIKLLDRMTIPIIMVI